MALRRAAGCAGLPGAPASGSRTRSARSTKTSSFTSRRSSGTRRSSRRWQSQILPAILSGQAGGGADSHLGRRLLDRRRGLLARDRAARVPGRLLAPRSDLRLRPQRADHRQGARRALPRRCAARRERRAAPALLRQDRPRLPHQQDGPRSVRLRPARPRPRPAVLEARSRELSQRPHLLRSGRCRSGSFRPFTTRLNQPGFLLLGRTESISGFSQLFSVVDKANKIFARTALPSTLRFAPRVDPRRVERPARGARPADAGPRQGGRRQAPRPPAPGPLRAAGRPHQREDGDPPVPRPDRSVSAAGARRAAERPHQDGAPRADLGAARGDRPGEEETGRRSGGTAWRSTRTGCTRTCNLVVLPFTGYPEMQEPLFVVLFEEAVARDARAGRVAPARRTGPASTARSSWTEDRRIPEARARAGGDQGVPAVADRGARADQRRSRLGQRGARLGQRRAPEHERGAGDGEGRAAVDQRRADHRQRRAPQPQSGGRAGQQRPPEPARHRRHPDRHPRPRAPHPPLHAQGAEHPERRPRRHSGVRSTTSSPTSTSPISTSRSPRSSTRWR